MADVFLTNSVEETIQLGRQLAGRLSAGMLVALEGDLGAGKTQLVRGLAEGLGVTDERAVSSPTYVLVQEYQGRVPIYHIDLYRLLDPVHEMGDLGLEEMLATGVVLIEWANRAEDAFPRPFWRMTIEHTGLEQRRFTWESVE